MDRAKEKVMTEIKEIMAEVESTWLANDGGLTMAASDLLAFGRSVLEDIECERIHYINKLDPLSADTGAEQDIIILAQEWARCKMWEEM